MSLQKEITVVLYDFRSSGGWCPQVDTATFEAFISSLHDDLNPFGITLTCIRQPENVLEVRGYGDLLNTVRLRSPRDHIANLCLGHIIGQSAGCDFYEDIRRGVTRVAFAPEMIEPEGSHKVVCHNCGCGC